MSVPGFGGSTDVLWRSWSGRGVSAGLVFCFGGDPIWEKSRGFKCRRMISWVNQAAEARAEPRGSTKSEILTRLFQESPGTSLGVHVAKALIQGEDLTGHWFDRTQEYAARNRGETFDRLQFATPETLYLSPLPCWKHLPEDAWRGRARHLIQEIEDETAAHLARTGSQPLGAAAILGRHPHHRPPKQKRSPAPLFHAFSAAARRELWEAYRLFVAAFRHAADKLRAGDRNAVFPLGSFPPALPFVGG